MKKKSILISACLFGHKCSYDGADRFDRRCVSLKEKYKLIPVCPEVLAGLGIPRQKHEIRSGDGGNVLSGESIVVSESGVNRSREFIIGAERAYDAVKNEDVMFAVMKEGSPSCGVERIYDGSFSGRCVAGGGVTSAYLSKHGIKVVSSENISLFLK